LCQVGREGGSGGTPVTLSSARDSGVIEEAADFLWGIGRPELADDLKPEERKARRGEVVLVPSKGPTQSDPRSAGTPAAPSARSTPTARRRSPEGSIAPETGGAPRPRRARRAAR